MKYRTLGKTGLKVSEVGMGTWQLAGFPWGWDAPDEQGKYAGTLSIRRAGWKPYRYSLGLWPGRRTRGKKWGAHTSEELIGKIHQGVR